MNTMSELKAKDCPVCGMAVEICGKPQEGGKQDRVWHPHAECFLGGKIFPLDQWNTRPRERELEALLRRALPACEYSAMKWKDKEGREDRVKLPSEINAVLGKGGE